MKSKLFLVLLSAAIVSHCRGQEALTNRLESLRPDVDLLSVVSIDSWRFNEGNAIEGSRRDLDDSAWPAISPGYSWSGKGTDVWLRAKVTVPGAVAGRSVSGAGVRLEMGMSNSGELYVDGQLKEAFRGDDGQYTLAEHAQPGQVFDIALHSTHNSGRLRFARLRFNVLPEFDAFSEEVTFLSLLARRLPADQEAIIDGALTAGGKCIQFTNVTQSNLESVRGQLQKARAELLAVSGLTTNYDVYYIGHAHIDMNWQWTWPETIDVCHRTWNSAMNLLDQFPEFRFVQSQPGAYVPIEKQFPDEFARMQAHVEAGKWELIGGMWNESDTDIPSGEGIARSCFLGQRYFKSRFGKYALTGWLPDSFGHAWQLPQIMQLAGMRYFYHMRCGNGMEFTWWQSPDGSRVLKATTDSYDTKPRIEQLIVPMENKQRFGLPQSVVIFGVGDHGGGPTREQILRIKQYQQDPIFPRVHFISADDFFEQLAQQSQAASLPVVDTDLQYIFQGCYTTHADAKTAIRRSENNLYSAETLSVLAAMIGEPYPVEGFSEAWKPVAFAQFHDVAAGSAIHSTYEWTDEQLAPAFRFEKDQTEKALSALTAAVDTRGSGSSPIVVWNTLSFPRDDVVQVSLDGAAQYHSVEDARGGTYPAQCMNSNTLIFAARNVPAFGHAVYFPRTDACAADGVELKDVGGTYELETAAFKIQISKATGALTRFYSKSARWNVSENAADANLFQLLGDDGNAWTIRYNGEDRVLATNGVKVSVIDQGPVFARVRVAHSDGKSSYTQDVTVFGALPRIDIPTEVNWQEEHELLKIRLPADVTRPEVNAQVPYASIGRPHGGEEVPGQKWMDLGEAAPAVFETAVPLDLSPVFNSDCERDFDGEGNGYPFKSLPDGLQHFGVDQAPFQLGQSLRPNTVIGNGQHISIPAGVRGNTLYLLGARVKGPIGTEIGFHLSDGSVEFRAFNLNNWKILPKNTSTDSELAREFPYPHSHGEHPSNLPKIWLVQVPVPAGANGLVLPRDGTRIFAATLATKQPGRTLYGLSVLNDSKYGFDVSNDVFRLTALRTSERPDPHPDTGLQSFTYSLYPHTGGWREAHTDEQALGLNIPLIARVTTPHPASQPIPSISLVNSGGKGDLIVGAFKHSEDGEGYILRFYEADGQDTQATIQFDHSVRAEQTDILERPLEKQTLTTSGNSVTLPVGHNQIVTLHVLLQKQSL